MRKAGIWQGRFQYVHKGHYHVFKEDLLQFQEKFVAIVNPNPSNPAYDYDRFDTEFNPFTYFQRMLLWKKIADESNVTVNMFPCWHAKKYVELENDFLPKKNQRCWIVPVTQGEAEERKARDLQNRGEFVHEANYTQENSSVAAISASMIRASVRRGTADYVNYIPDCILKLTEDLINEIDDNYYYIVPFIGDKVDVASLEYAIEQVRQRNANGETAYLVVAIMVKVNNQGANKWSSEKEMPWWFYPAEHIGEDNSCTYYTKMQLLNKLMEKIGERNYLLTPLFVQRDNFNILSDYCNSFLPTLNEDNVCWIINKNIPCYYKYGFEMYLRNNQFTTKEIVTQNKKEQSDVALFFATEGVFVYRPQIKGNKARLIFKIEQEKASKEISQRLDSCNKASYGLSDEEKGRIEQRRKDIEKLQEEWMKFREEMVGRTDSETDYEALEKEFDAKEKEILEKLEKI